MIGRTFSLPHKYFYCRFDGTWTPWEAVPLQIDGDLLAVTVWRSRLHLFWVTFMPKSQANPAAPTSGTISSLANQDISTVQADKTVSLQLNWSEYFQGKWSSRVASGFTDPVSLGNFEFDPTLTALYTSKDIDANGVEALNIYVYGQITHAFRLVTKNGEPLETDLENLPLPPYHYDALQSGGFQGSGPLAFSNTNIDVLAQGENPWLLRVTNAPPNTADGNLDLTIPFFYQDSHHTFFVEAEYIPSTVPLWNNWVIDTHTVVSASQIPGLDKNAIILSAVPSLQTANGGGVTDPIAAAARYSIQSQRASASGIAKELPFDGGLVGKNGATSN